ncbi:hypothetical protein [Lysinibacillus xylanilyticus]
MRKRSGSNTVLSVRKRSDSNNTRLSDQHRVGQSLQRMLRNYAEA